MAYPHPPRGTCVPECPMYGVCHCGCGSPTNPWRHHEQPKRNLYAGRPMTYIVAHNPHGGGNLVKSGIPIERVQAMVRFLWREHGSWTKAARAVGVPPTTLRHYLRPERKRIGPERAALIVEAVGQFRLPKRHALDTYEDGSLRRTIRPRHKGTHDYRRRRA